MLSGPTLDGLERPIFFSLFDSGWLGILLDPGLSKFLPLSFLSHRMFSLLNPSASSFFNPPPFLLTFQLEFSIVFQIVGISFFFFSSLSIVIEGFQFIRIQEKDKWKLPILGQINIRLCFPLPQSKAEYQIKTAITNFPNLGFQLHCNCYFGLVCIFCPRRSLFNRSYFRKMVK